MTTLNNVIELNKKIEVYNKIANSVQKRSTRKATAFKLEDIIESKLKELYSDNSKESIMYIVNTLGYDKKEFYMSKWK